MGLDREETRQQISAMVTWLAGFGGFTWRDDEQHHILIRTFGLADQKSGACPCHRFAEQMEQCVVLFAAT
jgi:hypothetical protein